MKSVSTKLPPEYIEAMDKWRLAQSDPRLTRSDALEYFVAKGLGMEPPSFEGRRRPVSRAEIEERGEHYCQLYAELGSYVAVAREVNRSVERVRQVIARYERINRS